MPVSEITTKPVHASPVSVNDRLRHAWHRERRAAHLRGACTLALWVVALAILDFLLDWLFLIPGYARIALLAINAFALAAVSYRSWWRVLQGYDPVRMALRIERLHPELESILVSYVQLQDLSPGDPHVSPRLVDALKRRAIEVTAPVRFDDIVNFREIRRILLFSAVVLIFFTATCVNWSEFFSVLAHRMFHPSTEQRYPTRTRIEAMTKDLVVRQGENVTIAFRTQGQKPARGTLQAKSEGQRWEDFALLPGKDASFTYEFPEAFRTFLYRARLGDAISETYRVQVIPPPQILSVLLTLEYPKSVGLEARTVDTMNLEVPEGTHIEWELKFDQALAAAEMLQEGSEHAPLLLSSDGFTAAFELAPAFSFHYQFVWSLKAQPFTYRDEVHYFVHVVPDAAPEVEILMPHDLEEKATVQKILSITFRAQDDHGLSEAWLVFSLNSSEEQRLALGKFKGASVQSETSWKLKQHIPALQEGDTLLYWVEVADNYSGEGGPHRGRSQPRRLTIVSLQAYLQDIYEKKSKLDAEIDSLFQQEKESSKNVKTLKTDPEVPAGPGEQ